MLLKPEASLTGTRTSHNWKSTPGNWDRLNTRALYASSNEYGIPDLPEAGFIPTELVPYNLPRAIEKAVPDSAVHFFLDDYRFETVWSQPNKSLSRIQRVGVALTPDFSLWREMPMVMQQWQVYRARWCGMWMYSHGIAVIPTVSWSTPESWKFCFLGIPRNSVVAISTVGTNDDAMPFFKRGVQAMVDEIDPSMVLVYGRMMDAFAGLNVKLYDHYWRQ